MTYEDDLDTVEAEVNEQVAELLAEEHLPADKTDGYRFRGATIIYDRQRLQEVIEGSGSHLAMLVIDQQSDIMSDGITAKQAGKICNALDDKRTVKTYIKRVSTAKLNGYLEIIGYTDNGAEKLILSAEGKEKLAELGFYFDADDSVDARIR